MSDFGFIGYTSVGDEVAQDRLDACALDCSGCGGPADPRTGMCRPCEQHALAEIAADQDAAGWR